MSVLDMVESGIANVLQWDTLPSSESVIRRHKKLRMGSMNATCQCLGRKPCKNDRVHRSDSGTRQLQAAKKDETIVNKPLMAETIHKLYKKTSKTYHRHGQFWDHSVQTNGMLHIALVRSMVVSTSSVNICKYCVETLTH